MPGPDQQGQQRPHDEVGDDAPVAPGEAEPDDRRHLAGQCDNEPRRPLHDEPPSGSSGGGAGSGGDTPGGVVPGG